MKKWWYREEYVGDILVNITSYGEWEEDSIIRFCKREPDKYDPEDWHIRLFDTEEEYLNSLEDRVLQADCSITYTNYNANNLKAHTILDNKWKRERNLPNPIIEDGKAVCPICGEEIYRSGEVILTNPPWYTYYCKNCPYHKELNDLIKEARLPY